ncbi:MAG: SoxR reducing system RseC family protein [Candidatus Aminicenantales bacterium]
MIDDAVVVSTQKDMARVKVTSSSLCCSCSARLICQGQQGEGGTLTVFNPLKAAPGDLVKINIPEAKYNRETLRIFGILLISSLLGLALGYLAAPMLKLPAQAAGFIGLLVGLALGGLGLFRYSRTQNKRKLYPVILAIVHKGETHG